MQGTQPNCPMNSTPLMMLICATATAVSAQVDIDTKCSKEKMNTFVRAIGKATATNEDFLKCNRLVSEVKNDAAAKTTVFQKQVCQDAAAFLSHVEPLDESCKVKGTDISLNDLVLKSIYPCHGGEGAAKAAFKTSPSMSYTGYDRECTYPFNEVDDSRSFVHS